MFKPNSILVYNFVKENEGKNFTAADIAEGTGLDVKQVNGIVTSAFAKKGYMVREEAEIEITKEDGSKGHKAVKFIRLTEEGKKLDVNATDDEQ